MGEPEMFKVVGQVIGSLVVPFGLALTWGWIIYQALSRWKSDRQVVVVERTRRLERLLDREREDHMATRRELDHCIRVLEHYKISRWQRVPGDEAERAEEDTGGGEGRRGP